MAQQPVNFFGGNTLQSYLDTAQGLQGLERGALQNQALSGQVQQQQSTNQRKEEARAQVAEVFKNRNPMEIAEFSLKNPEFQDLLKAAEASTSKFSKQAKIDATRNIIAGGDQQRELANLAQKIKDSGGDPSDTIALMEQPPEVIMKSAEMLNASLDSDGYIARHNSQEGLTAGQREFNDLIREFSPEEQITAKKVKAGLKGRAMSNAVLSAIKSGDVKNLADAKAEIKQAEKFGEMSATSRAKTIDKSFDSIAKIDNGLGNIDDAISALNSGAGVGAIERFLPSIKASTLELANIRGRMALDVIGSTTFGALSEGELALAQDIALPTGLNTNELIDFLQRKKTAQTKLKDYYGEQIQFLDQGGTVAGFLRQKERDASGQQAASTQESFSDGQTATSPDGRKAVYTNGQWVVQ